MAGFRVFELRTFTDERGKLTPMELTDFFDFVVKRVYTVHANLATRGGHAHLEEEEFFFLTSGSAVAKLHDGEKWLEIPMTANNEALYVGNYVWHQFEDFSADAVLVALSSTNYNPERADYIEDFNQFLNTKF